MDETENKDITQVPAADPRHDRRACASCSKIAPVAASTNASGACRATTADLVLTLVPPHRSYRPDDRVDDRADLLRRLPPSTNICTFCPGRDYMTLNFVVDERHIDHVDRIMPLIEQAEAL